MSEAGRCPRCGSPLGGDSIAGLCPACMLEQGLESQSKQGDAGHAVTVDLAQTGAASATLVKESPTLIAGTIIANYRIVRRLGHGGMGTVYEAEQLDSGRTVALKLLAHSLDSPEARKRFFREGRLAAAVNHPNCVYVYGTEEIDDQPAISMELVGYGTLAEWVKKSGPLATTTAVDAILQVIAGLEAAQAQGVLHRDVKPSNCFVDADANVKVGDFGLSISTTSHGESHLTNSGAFLGTPAFSSPEQIKGDELDVRSDIYAVGVTLYYLLTGRTPFTGDNMVKLLAAVLEQQAVSPQRWRPEIPADLARVVMHCLEKQPAHRFANYEQVREALKPFSSSVPAPANLYLRFAAGAIDMLMFTLMNLIAALCLYLKGVNLLDPKFTASRQALWLSVPGMALWLGYFSLAEGLLGASLGKWLFRMRLANKHRNTPGVFRALVRALIFIAFPSIPYFIGAAIGLKYDYQQPSDWRLLALSAAYYLMFGLLFVTARRRNGYAGLHDLASGTRVIMRPKTQRRPMLPVIEVSSTSAASTIPVGPYHVLETLGASGGANWLLGYDTRLLRKVWIRQVPAGTPPVAEARRNLARGGRLHWLAGKRAATENWDAFEAVPGQALVNLPGGAQPWESVRFWLFDLAQELGAALKDNTLPSELRLSQIWIGSDGRARLLDDPAPGSLPAADDDAIATAPGEVAPTLRFLHEVAINTLRGKRDRSAHKPGELGWGLVPLHAQAVLDRIIRAERPEVAVAELAPLLDRKAKVTFRRRVGLLAATLAFPIIMSAFLLVGFLIMRQSAAVMPDIAPLRESLMLYEPFPGHAQNKAGPGREALETYIVGRFGPMIRDPKIWSSLYVTSSISPYHKKLAEQLVARRARPTDEQLRQAARVVEPFLSGTQASQPLSRISVLGMTAMMFVVALIMYVTIPSLIAALVARGGLLMAMFGVAVVRRDGRRASRSRVFMRQLIVWTPVLASILAFALFAPLNQPIAAGIACVALVVLGIVADLLPGRSFADRLVRTDLVPR